MLRFGGDCGRNRGSLWYLGRGSVLNASRSGGRDRILSRRGEAADQGLPATDSRRRRLLQLGPGRRGTGPARRPVVAALRSTKKAVATRHGPGEAAAPALCDEDRAATATSKNL
jgi:hypothetical protein